MMKNHAEDNYEEAERLANRLIAIADTPFLIRAKAHMVIGCGDSENFLFHAEEGVRIVELGIQTIATPEPGSDKDKAARSLLKQAQMVLAVSRIDTL